MKSLKRKVFWADSIVEYYLHRPKLFEHLCTYDFVYKYKNVCIQFKQMKDSASGKLLSASGMVDDMADEEGGNDDARYDKNGHKDNSRG